MVKFLREAEASSVAEVAGKHKVSEQTIYIWRKKFGALDPAGVKHLHSLEVENATPKHMIAGGGMALKARKEINRRKWRARRRGASRLPLPLRVGTGSAGRAS